MMSSGISKKRKLVDKFFGTWPWLTGIFTVFGIIAAFINLFRIGSAGNDDSTGSGTGAAGS